MLTLFVSFLLSHHLVSLSLNGDLYHNIQLLLLQSETEIIHAVTRPNMVFRLCSLFLSLLLDTLSTYRLMLENAAYSNHDVVL